MISLVIPAFNEEENIGFLYDKIKRALNTYSYECIFVDDGSKDATYDNIKKLSEKHENVKGLSFSRNFGHQVALLAGIKEAKGDVVIMMDADGQHPPEIIPQLLQRYQEGFDIVNTKRLTTKDAGVFKNVTSRLFYKIINYITEIKIEPASSDFRLMSRKAVDAFLSIEENDRFTRGLVSWIGFNQAIVEFEAPERMSGKSKYTFKKMLNFAWDGITSFSSKPLKLSLYLGVLSIFMGLVYSIYILIAYMMNKTMAGWASTMLIILFLGGAQLLSIGIIGEYLARIFNETKNRPLFFIKDRC